MLENLIKLRKGRGLRQKDVADTLNIATSTYSYWEKGINEPDLKSLVALADFFEVSTDYLLSHKQPQNVSLIINTNNDEMRTYHLATNELKIITQLADELAKR